MLKSTYTPITVTLHLHHAPAAANSTLSLHDALPISSCAAGPTQRMASSTFAACAAGRPPGPRTAPSAACASPASRCTCRPRSEEHTSELQSLAYLVCRLLLEKKNYGASYFVPLAPPH